MVLNYKFISLVDIVLARLSIFSRVALVIWVLQGIFLFHLSCQIYWHNVHNILIILSVEKNLPHSDVGILRLLFFFSGSVRQDLPLNKILILLIFCITFLFYSIDFLSDLHYFLSIPSLDFILFFVRFLKWKLKSLRPFFPNVRVQCYKFPCKYCFYGILQIQIRWTAVFIHSE